MTPRTVTIEVDLQLVERFRAARDARRAAGERLEAVDDADTFAAFNSALRAEEEAASWLALHVDNQAKEG